VGLALVTLLLFLACVAYSQTPTGTIQGTVSDPTGAAILGAVVTATDIATGTKTTTNSGSDGIYAVRNLVPGTYSIRVEMPGFTTTLVQNLVVTSNSVATANAKMEIGQTASVVEVEATAVQVDTVRQTVDTPVGEKEIKSLPIFSRNFLDLAALAPGVQVRDGGNIDPTKSNAFRTVGIAGRSGTATRVQVDGIDITDETVGTTTGNVSQDSVQEFTVSRSSLDPSTSLTSSGAINIVSKSGSNTLHGTSFFDYYNQDLSSRPGYLSISPDTNRKRYGAGAGGAFIKNKLFFYGNLERQDQTQAQIFNSGTFPQYNASAGLPLTNQLATGRLDWVIGAHANMFYRFNHSDDLSTGGTPISPFQNIDRTNFHVVGLNLAFTKSTHNFRYGYNKFNNHIDSSQLSTPFPTQDGQPFQLNISNVSVGPNGLAPQQTLQQNNQLSYEGTYQAGKHGFRWGGSWTRVVLGGFANFAGPLAVFADYSTELVNQITAAGLNPADPLNYPLTDFQMGPQSGFFTVRPSFNYAHGGHFDNRYGLFLQDSFRVNRRLTINLGVRWQYDTDLFADPNVKRDPIFNQWLPGASNNPIFPKDAFSPSVGFAWDPTGSGKTSIRGGFYRAYEMNIFNNTIFDEYSSIPAGIGPDVYTSAYVGQPNGNPLNFDGNHPDGDYTALQGMTLKQALPTIVALNNALQSVYKNYKFDPSQGPSAFRVAQGVTFGGIFPGDQYKVPYSLQFNIGFQRELKPGLVFSVDYLRNHGIGLPMQLHDYELRRDASTLNPAAAASRINNTLGGLTVDQFIAANSGVGINAFGLANDTVFQGLTGTDYLRARIISGGFSLYQGLEFSLRGRLPAAPHFLHESFVTVAYALSRADSTSVVNAGGRGEFIASNNNNHNPNDPNWFGPTPLDNTHRLNLSHNMNLPWGLQINTFWHLTSRGAGTLTIPNLGAVTGGSNELFSTDVNGDGRVAGQDLLTGTKGGQLGRGIGSVSDINNAINQYNQQYAGKLTPAGQALVSAGLFTQAQLVQLGAVTPTLATIPTSNPSPFAPWNFTTDIRLTKVIRFKERFEVRPFMDVFNLFNHAPFAGYAGGGLGGTFGSLNYNYAGAPAGQQFSDLELQNGRITDGRRLQFGVRLDF
jgi:hypothetical protein